MISSHWATETIQMKVVLNTGLGTGFEPRHIFMLEAICCTLAKDGDLRLFPVCTGWQDRHWGWDGRWQEAFAIHP